jgi:hypothetical protein
MLSRAVFVLCTASIFVSAPAANAQIVPMGGPFGSRWTIGGDFAISQPKGAFAENVPTGYGFDAVGLMKLDSKGWFSIRADGGSIRYGHEHIPLGFGTLGVQLQFPDGAIRPYGSASYGAVYLQTESCVSDPDGLVQQECRTNHGDWTSAGVFGGGLSIPFGKSFFALNLGAQYHYGGMGTYLRRGDIIDNPDGSVTLNVRESKTDLVLWQIGFTYNIPR